MSANNDHPESLQATDKRNESAVKIWRVGTLTYTGTALTVLFLWLLFGDFAWSLRERSIWPMSSWYLNELGISSLLFGILMSSLPALIGMTLVPIISMKSDRCRSRWGRRIPFLLITTPMASLGMVGLGLTPVLSQWMHAHVPEMSETMVALICFTVFWAVFEVASLGGQAIFGGLINDVVPRELLGRFYGLFRAVSLFGGIIFNFWLTGKTPTHYTLMLVIIGLAYGAAFTLMCFKVKEGKYAPPEPRSTGQGGLRTYFRECFSNPYYVWVFIMMTASAMAFVPLNTFSVPYAESLGVNMDFYGKALATTYVISLLLAWFLGWLADRFHPLRVSIATLLGYLLVAVYGAFFAITPKTYLVGLVLHGVLSGCYFTSAASLAQRLFPHERFAQFFSAAGMVQAPVSMLLAPLVGMAIDGVDGAYRFTFVAAGFIALIALATSARVYIQFMRLGGPKGYVAPE